jgi:hypothetical protein
MARSSYPEPAVPGKFSRWVTKKSATEWVRDWRTGQNRRRTVDCWDVQGRADGVLWAKRFRRAGLARNRKERLDGGYAAGLSSELSNWASNDRTCRDLPFRAPRRTLPTDVRRRHWALVFGAGRPVEPESAELMSMCSATEHFGPVLRRAQNDQSGVAMRRQALAW